MTSLFSDASHAGPASPCLGVDARNGWTDAAVELLSLLWIEGDLSAALIARRLGVTRNAVLGKVHRLGLSHRRPPKVRRPRAPREPRARRTAGAPATRRSAAAARAPDPAPVVDVGPGLCAHLEDMPHRGCRSPLGDPRAEDFSFCGRRTAVPPYCDPHRALAFQPGGVVSAERLLRRFGD